MSLISLLLTVLSARACLANVEKAIFLGPQTIRVPAQHPTISDLRLDVLTPDNWSLRTQIKAEFPSKEHPEGYTSWYLLNNLTEGQRYEARICWPATVSLLTLNHHLDTSLTPLQQPTSFTLDTFPLNTVWDTPDLLLSLGEFSMTRQSSGGGAPGPKADEFTSLLFLRVIAAADYFTTNETLMESPEPVDVDIILDPFLFNVLPRSLLPTVGYVIVVAGVSFFVAKYVVAFLQGIVKSDAGGETKKRQ
jgi:hypothetical protein